MEKETAGNRTENEELIITTTEHIGPFRRAIPIMPMLFSGICCFCNIFVPGLGTLLAAFSILCCAKVERCGKFYGLWMNLLAAIIQFITFPLVVGCVWSVYWGVLFIMAAQEHQAVRDVNNRPRSQQPLVHMR